MPNSLESSESEFSNENQQNIINRNVNLGKKNRHQSFSKNIYIGTKNAEKWDSLRSNLSYKNDVEFVSYLLSLAEKEQLCKTGFNNNAIKCQKDLCKDTTEVVEITETPERKSRKVQFQDADDLNNKCVDKNHEIQIEDDVEEDEDVDIAELPICLKRTLTPPLTISEKDESFSIDNNNSTVEILDCRIAEKIKSEIEEQKLIINEEPPKLQEIVNVKAVRVSAIIKDATRKIKKKTKDLKPVMIKSKKRKAKFSFFNRRAKQVAKIKKSCESVGKRKLKNDIRKAPSALKNIEIAHNSKNCNIEINNITNKQDEEILPLNEEILERKEDENEEKFEKNRACKDCKLKHKKDKCLVTSPSSFIVDSINLFEWQEKNKDLVEEYTKNKNIKIKSEELEEEDEGDDSMDNLSIVSGEEYDYLEKPEIPDDIVTFSEATLPEQFELRLLSQEDGHGIFAKILIKKFTQLGPLIGTTTLETDLNDDCNMRYIIETFDGTRSHYISMENKNESNWLRYIRPAINRELRNTTLICKDKMVYFVTCDDIDVGCELLYWSDDINSAWEKKKIDRTNCGGCNLKFDHPLYYRTHCSVFHDPAFSLTIRKYHCKVCGIAVLGKENIMKHAAQLHEGKGAYQCQYCKKFFLRLNYLEMHRTYGCSANPQRARPLCDFCGRKFCQPQKLKVHIKRMHSDMAEVLRDFQCKLCSKLLGSRAALQRHSKEVHSRNSAVVGCPRCQKLFQNRSNLKIHMLTHSGVRPFRCAENECNAAFTTKQCLQFHYKKVHGFTQDQMPKIERSVAYTFDAYSGGLKVDISDQKSLRRCRRRNLEDSGSINQDIEDQDFEENDDEESYTDKPHKVSDELPDPIKQQSTSISEICETNLSLLSTTISSFLNQEIARENVSPSETDEEDDQSLQSNALRQNEKEFDSDMVAEKGRMDFEENQNIHPPPEQQSAQLSLVESFLSETSPRMELEQSEELPMVLSPSQIEKNNYRNTGSLKVQEFAVNNQNIVASKGSKKWINTTNCHMISAQENEQNLLQANRDFLSKFMMHENSNCDENDEDDDNSTILDVGETPHIQNSQQYNSPESMTQSMQHLTHPSTSPHLHMQHHHNHHQNSLVSGFYNNNNRIAHSSSISSSASMLVEAALSSVSNIIDNEHEQNCSIKSSNCKNRIDDEDISNINNVQNDHDNPSIIINSSGEYDTQRGYQHNSNGMKIIKNNYNNMSHHMSPIAQYMATSSSHSPSPMSNNILKDTNDIDVDTVSTTTLDKTNKLYHENDSFGNQTSPSPRPISPGQDYPASVFNSSENHISASMLLSNARRGYSVPENHLNLSPSPSLPRYDFSSDARRKRDHDIIQLEHTRHDMHDSQQMSQLSSDEENSIVVAQNLSINNQNEASKIKPHSHIDLLYAKYENVQGNLIHEESDINDTRLKYSNDQTLDIAEFRSNSSNETVSEFQGIDMTSRSAGLGSGYHNNNFQMQSSGVNLSLNRYHHHIYDILSEREQQEHQLPLQQQQQQLQHLMQEQLNSEMDQQDQATSVDLSRTAGYVSSSQSIPYSHHHSDMLRMVSLDLTPSGGGTMLGNTHLRHSSSILASQIQHNSREAISVAEHNRLMTTAEQHRLLTTSSTSEQLSSNHRLLVDPFLVDSTSNRHMVVQSRGFGAYHHHQVPSSNYHHNGRTGLSSPHPNPTNYHPFSAYY